MSNIKNWQHLAPTFLNIDDNGDTCIEWFAGDVAITFWMTTEGPLAIRSIGSNDQECDEDSATAAKTLKRWLNELIPEKKSE